MRDYADDQATISLLLLRSGDVVAGIRNLLGTLLVRPTALPAIGKPYRALKKLQRSLVGPARATP
jgi:hypothetical protein